jgi:hypothetical protein
VNGVSTGGTNLDIIPSMQGFFVHVSDGAFPVTGTLNMTNSARITNLTQPYLKSAKTITSDILRLSVTFTDDVKSIDPMVIYFDNMATEAFDSRYDALKLMNTDLKVPNIYSVLADGSKLSINGLPGHFESFQVPLGLKANKAGTITFRLMNSEGALASRGVSLLDSGTGISQSLLNGNEYVVTLAQGEYLNRFYLSLGSVTTGIGNTSESDQPFSIYSSKGIVRLNVTSLPEAFGYLTLFNILGEAVFRERIDGPGYYEFSPDVKEGIYIAVIISGNNRMSRKLHISGK